MQIRQHDRAFVWHLIRLAAAVVVLNGALTFTNVWPTLGVHWRGRLSVELAVLLAVLAATHSRTPPHWRTVRTALVVALMFGVLGRYADVTAPALYGRPINLYWDLPHVPEIFGMLSRVAPTWLLVVSALAAVAALAAMFFIFRWALGEVQQAMQRHRPTRVGLATLSVLLVLCFVSQQLTDHRFPPGLQFAMPVSQTYAVQIARATSVLSGIGTRSLPPSPTMRPNLTALNGDDVLLIFIESYGRTTYDRAEYRDFLQPSRAGLQTAIQNSGRQVVSAFVTSPTFAGTSVLAHLSLLSGIQVRSSQEYQLLMTQQRPTLVSTFHAAGYRTVAVMPGNQHAWPEGSFYGFDRIYAEAQLRYRGPQFGWWHIPDQFSLEALDADELQPRSHQPLFVFFPTVSTHIPFRPIPPLQTDWLRMLSPQPYDADKLSAAMSQRPEWNNLGESYVSAVQYFFESFTSFLTHTKDDPSVVILLGDHQPASSVSGEGASWDVPVHVITSRPEILNNLRSRGFQAGLTPSGPALGDMNELALWLLSAFSQPPSAIPHQPHDIQ